MVERRGSYEPTESLASVESVDPRAAHDWDHWMARHEALHLLPHLARIIGALAVGAAVRLYP